MGNCGRLCQILSFRVLNRSTHSGSRWLKNAVVLRRLRVGQDSMRRRSRGEARGCCAPAYWRLIPFTRYCQEIKTQHSEKRTDSAIRVPVLCLVSKLGLQAKSHRKRRSDRCPGAGSSRLKLSFNSPIATIGGPSRRKAKRSQPQISPLTSKPSFSRCRFTGRYRLLSEILATANPDARLRGVSVAQ